MLPDWLSLQAYLASRKIFKSIHYAAVDEVLAESDEAVPLWTLEPWESAFHDAVAPLYERQLLLAPPGMPSESSDVKVGWDPHRRVVTVIDLGRG